MDKTRQEYAKLKATGLPYQSGQELPTQEGEGTNSFDPALDDPPVEISSDSDSSDFEHDGNGTPCRFYNHGGCGKGSSCQFKHSPTKQMTTRDELFVFFFLHSFSFHLLILLLLLCDVEAGMFAISGCLTSVNSGINAFMPIRRSTCRGTEGDLIKESTSQCYEQRTVERSFQNGRMFAIH
jgi:hypothetical protein